VPRVHTDSARGKLSMSTVTYYFSGTGNSLVVAKNIAEKMGGTLMSIPSVIDKERVDTLADVIGIVFPVYYATNDSGVPLIVGRFVMKLENIGSKYIFAVCTHGGTPGTTVENLAKIIKACGGELAMGFTIRMSISDSPVEKLNHALFHRKLEMKTLTNGNKRKKVLDNWNEKLETIQEYVRARRTGKFETRGTLRKLVVFVPLHLLIRPMFSRRYRRLSKSSTHLPFSELIPLADRSFKYNDKCDGCKICSRVCPVNNIKMIDKRPAWQHHCENCYACFQWCPKEAIQGTIVEYEKRYHHPDVKLSDMLKKPA